MIDLKKISAKFDPLLQSNFFIYLCYVGALIFFFGRMFATTFMHGDFIAYWVPNYAFILDSLKNGQLPFWQPYSYLGLPEIFKLELVFFYPPTWIVLLINLLFNRDLNLTMIGKSLELMQYFNLSLGAMGMYLLLRKHLQLSVLPSFAAGLVFVLSQYITVQGGDLSSMPGKLLLPWLILFLLNFLEQQNFKNYVTLVVCNLILFTLGYPYNFVYFFLIQAGLAAFYGLRKFFLTGLALGNAALIAGFLLLPNYHILSQSFRGLTSAIEDPYFHYRNALTPTKIISIFNPLPFGQLYDKRDPLQLFSLGMLHWGVIPLIFLCTGFAHLKRTALSTWLILLFVFGIVLSLGGYLNAPYFLGVIFPIIEKFRSHAQLLSLTFFAGTIIIAHGIEAMLDGKKDSQILFILWQVALLGTLLFFWLPFGCQDCTATHNDVVISFTRSLILLVVGLILFHFTQQTKNRIFFFAIVIITLLEYSFYAYNVPYLRMPTSYSDYYRHNSLLVEIPSNNNLFRYQFAENQFIYNTSFLKVFNAQGYETVPYQAWYNLSRFGEEKTLQFTNTKYLVTTEGEKEKKLSNLKLVKTVAPADHPEETFYGTVDGLAYFSPQRNFRYYIYEVQNYLPRFFVPQKVESCPDPSCYDKEQPQVLSFVKESGINIQNPPASDVKITVNSYEANAISLHITTSAETFISSSEILDKGWSLTLNGTPAPLYNVSNGFRGVIVPGGEHTIEMQYFPPYLWLGMFVSAAGIALLISFPFSKKILDLIMPEKRSAK